MSAANWGRMGGLSTGGSIFTKDEKSFTAFGNGYYGKFQFGPSEE